MVLEIWGGWPWPDLEQKMTLIRIVHVPDQGQSSVIS